MTPPRFPTAPRARGFTLIELMIVCALVAVLLALAVPSFRDFIAVQRLRGTNAQLVTDLQFARSEAVSRQAVVGVSFGSTTGAAGMSCYTIHTCGTVMPASCSCTCTAAEGSRCLAPRTEIRTVQIPLSSAVRLTSIPVGASTSTSYRLMYDPTNGSIKTYFDLIGVVGLPEPPANDLWLQASLTLPGETRAIRTEVNATGRPRVCAPTGSVLTGVSAC